MTNGKKRRTPRQMYLQWQRQRRALNDNTLPVDVYLRRYDVPQGFNQRLDAAAFEAWARKVNFRGSMR